MNLFKSFLGGLKKASGAARIVSIIYGITLLLGLILAFTFNSVITKNFGGRLELYSLYHDFNFTIYSDFMNQYGNFFRPLISMMIWFGFFYFFFTVFFSGGILKLWEDSSLKNKVHVFFVGSAKFFFRFLRLGVYILLFQIIVFAIIAVGFSAIFKRELPNSTEPKLFSILVVWTLIHAVFFVFISIVSDYAKIILVKEDSKKVWRSLWTSFKFTLKKLYLTYPLYIMLLVIPGLLFAAYIWIEGLVGMTTFLSIVMMFLVQQIFIWLRLFIKVWILASERELFTFYLTFRNQPLITQEILMSESL